MTTTDKYFIWCRLTYSEVFQLCLARLQGGGMTQPRPASTLRALRATEYESPYGPKYIRFSAAFTEVRDSIEIINNTTGF